MYKCFEGWVKYNMDKIKNDYWAKSAEKRIEKSEESENKIIEKIRKLWDEVEDEIEKELTKFYYKNIEGTNLKLEDLHEVLSKEENAKLNKKAKNFYKEAKEKSWQSSYQKEVLNVSLRKKMKRLEELKLILNHILQSVHEYEQLQFSTGLKTIYETIYTKTMYDFQSELNFGVKFDLPNESVIKNILEQNWVGSNFVNRIWKIKGNLRVALEQELLRGFALGENPKKIAKRLSDKIGIAKRNAERLVRTEFNHIANEASFNAIQELDKKLGGGVFVKYIFLATLDKRTSEICQNLDLKEFLFTEKQEGINFPPIHPNCRSTYKTVIKRGIIGDRIAKRLDTGEVEYIPANITYKEWVEKFQKNT